MSGAPSEDAVAAGRLVRALFLRTAWFLATLVGAALLLQLLLTAAPGNPIDLLPNGEELRPRLEAEWGLDRPLPVRLVSSVTRALAGDLGTSLTVRPGAPVGELVRPAAWRSLKVLLPALILALGLALPLARLTAGRTTPVRRVIEALSVAPVFLLAYLIVMGLNETAFALIEGDWIGRPSWFALPDQQSALRTAIAIAVLAVGSSSLTELHGSIEGEILHIRQSGYYEAALARGAPTGPHELWNLLLPLATLAASRMTFMVGGLVIVEKVLLMNGAGALLWDSCLKRDYNVALGLTLVAALAVCVARLLAEIARVAVDPRLPSPLVKELRPHLGALTGGALLAVVLLAWVVSILSGFDVIADVDPTQASLGPGGAHTLGTDHLGRDVFWRLITASEAFVGPSLVAGVVALLVGLPAAGWAGYRGGFVALGVRYLYTVLGSLPRFVLVLLCCAIYGNETMVIALAAGVAYAPTLGEAVTARVEELRSADFVAAARAHGVSPMRILWFHLLWVNCRALVARHLLYLFGYYLLLETTLGYIGGFGVEEPQPSWGNMLAFEFGVPDGNSWAWAAPALAIWLTILGTALSASALAGARRA